MGVKYVPLGEGQTLEKTDLGEEKETTVNPVQVSCSQQSTKSTYFSI